MPLFDTCKPKYPVVEPTPSMERIVYNFNLKDWATVALFSGAGFTTGWFGANKPLRWYNSRFLLFIGFYGGMVYSTQNSMHRLMGFIPNDREVQLYGVASPERIARAKLLAENPNLELIDSTIED